MSVTMFNCGFGDCFCIENEYVERPLYVDFGIISGSLKSPKGLRELSEMKIGLHMWQQKEKDFLLTHFHEDHYSGILFLHGKKYFQDNMKFNTVYLPNVFDPSFQNTILSVIISTTNKSVYRLPKLDLVEFLKILCDNKSNIRLISRGDRISKDLIALWPVKNLVEEESTTEISNLIENRVINASDVENLISMATNINTAVGLMVNGEFEKAKRKLEAINPKENQALLDTLTKIKRKGNKLNELGNNISIVFQNEIDPREACGEIMEEYESRDILFTGDVSKSVWNMITHMPKCEPKDLRMFAKYHLIKIPHHGTESYYYNFEEYIVPGKTVCLIPNEPIEKKDKNGKTHVCGIADDYKGDLKEAHVYTSQNNISSWKSTGTKKEMIGFDLMKVL